MKIHILGGMGSGKTTLAKTLAAQGNAPHYDLDKILWENGSRLEAYVDGALSIAAQPAWVSEGIYVIWIDPLLYQADRIVLLEVHWLTAAWRILVRHFRLTLRGTNPYPTRILLPFLKDTRRYYTCRSDERVMAQVLSHQAGDGEPPEPARLLERLGIANASLPMAADFTRRYLQKYQPKLSVVRNQADRQSLLQTLGIDPHP